MEEGIRCRPAAVSSYVDCRSCLGHRYHSFHYIQETPTSRIPLSPDARERIITHVDIICRVNEFQFGEFERSGLHLDPHSEPILDRQQSLDALRDVLLEVFRNRHGLKAAISGRPRPNAWLPWIHLYYGEPGDEIPLRVGIYFGFRGDGIVAGIQVTKWWGPRTSPWQPRPRRKRIGDEIFIDLNGPGGRQDTNSTFLNPAQFPHRDFDAQAFIDHLEESLAQLESLLGKFRGLERPDPGDETRPRREDGPRGRYRMKDLQGALREAGDPWFPRVNPISDLTPGRFKKRLGVREERLRAPDQPSPCADVMARGNFAEVLADFLAARRFHIRPAQQLGLHPNPWRASNPGAYQEILGSVCQRLHRLPERVDWRNDHGKSRVTPVRDQGECGSCVSFGVIATLESMLLVERDLEMDLSEAELQFCGGGSCGGWWPRSAICYVREEGVAQESGFPYVPRDVEPLRPPERDQQAIAAGLCVELRDDEERKAFLALVGPMTAVIEVYRDFSAYGGGVYRPVLGELTGYHCVQIVGYDDHEGCWIGKNSWGTAWGEGGFFRLAYGECGVNEPFQPFHGLGATHWWAS